MRRQSRAKRARHEHDEILDTLAESVIGFESTPRTAIRRCLVHVPEGEPRPGLEAIWDDATDNAATTLLTKYGPWGWKRVLVLNEIEGWERLQQLHGSLRAIEKAEAGAPTGVSFCHDRIVEIIAEEMATAVDWHDIDPLDCAIENAGINLESRKAVFIKKSTDLVHNGANAARPNWSTICDGVYFDLRDAHPDAFATACDAEEFAKTWIDEFKDVLDNVVPNLPMIHEISHSRLAQALWDEIHLMVSRCIDDDNM